MAPARLNRGNKKLKRISQPNKIVPGRANAMLAIAVRHQLDGRLAEARAVYVEMIRANPNDFIALNNLGLIATDQGREDEAEGLFRASVALNSKYLMPHINLGNIFSTRKKFAEALWHYEQGLQIDPKYSALLVNLGNLYRDHGKYDEAIASYNQALALEPDMAEAHLNLGNVFVYLNREREAVVKYERALALQPQNAGAHNCMGVVLLKIGEIDRSKTALEQSLRFRPDFTDALLNLGNVFTALGQTTESVRCYQRILELQPEHTNAQSNLLSSLNYCDSIPPAEIARQCRSIGAMMERRFLTSNPLHRNQADPDRRLRVGYVSPDFRMHAVAFFLSPLLSHDRGAVEIFCYAEVLAPDHVTDRFRTFADHWISTVGVSDDDLAARIEQDGIDILIDLAGHTDKNRLPVFARRPAPVQMTWIGYPNTTGLKTIDYRLVDSITDPPGQADEMASETLLRLDGCFVCYEPNKEAPPPVPPPSILTGIVTFGTLNNLAKLSDASIHVWSQLLAKVPTARLLVKSRYFAAEESKNRFLARLKEHGVGPERVILLGPNASNADHLSAYHQIDIALDSFPYNGTTTTCESLWMGVPVVALTGDTHCGRVGMSLLTATGLTELIARDKDDYVRIAADLAGDPVRLAALNQGLRARVAASALCDAPAFARKIEAAYRMAWTRWCAKQQPAAEVATVLIKAGAEMTVPDPAAVTILPKAAAVTTLPGTADRKSLPEAFVLKLSDGSILALPPTLDAITTYVVLEQERWFEKEAAFPSSWLKPGMTVIEIGANLGIYSVPMARAVAPSGHVIAYEPGTAAANLLEHSRDLNNATTLTVVRAALSDTSRTGFLLHGMSNELNKLGDTGTGERVDITCLDDEDCIRGWDPPDFVKIDAEGEEERILRGGVGFFTRHSPLVMFGVANPEVARAPTCDAFRSLGYGLYRLLAGAPVLVPDTAEALDIYELNLFAAKPDRAAALARDGWLVEALPEWSPSEIDRKAALAPLRQLPCAAAFSDLLDGMQPVDPSYRDCLAGFAAWRSPDLALPERCAALEFALAGLVTLNTQAASPARLLTLARVSLEAGRRGLCVQVLRHFLTELKDGVVHLQEPFWPPGVRFDALMPAGTIHDWVMTSVYEQIERLGHHSSFYTGMTAGLEWLCGHSFGSAEMERRRVLIRARSGQKTEVSPNLCVAAAGHINAAFWQAASVPNTTVPGPSASAPDAVASQCPGQSNALTKVPALNSVLEALSLLKPYDIDIPKRRIGPDADGGYVFADRLSVSQAVLSYGIGTEYRFDIEMANAGHKVYMFDHTIDGIEATHPNLQWFREGVSGNRMPNNGLYTIADHLARCHIEGDRLILKMDVEGAEYDALGMIPDEVLGRFEQIVVEVHWLARLGDASFLQDFVRMVKNLNRHFTLFHVHANNFDGANCIHMVEGLPVSNLLELSYIKTTAVSRSRSQTLYPTAHDYPNLAGKDKLLWFFPFLPSDLDIADYRLCEQRAGMLSSPALTHA